MSGSSRFASWGREYRWQEFREELFCPGSFTLHWTNCGTSSRSNDVCPFFTRKKLMTGELMSPAETTVYRQCVGGVLYYTQDRTDAQYEVSILGSMGKTDSRVDDCSENA